MTATTQDRYKAAWERVKGYEPGLADELDLVVGELLTDEEDRVRADIGDTGWGHLARLTEEIGLLRLTVAEVTLT